MSSEGTSLEDIEMGNVAHSADDHVMNAILSDMNAVEDIQQSSHVHHEQPVYIPPPQPPQQPMMPQFLQPEPSFPAQDPYAFPAAQSMHYDQAHMMQPPHQQNQNQAHYEPVEVAGGSGIGSSISDALKKNSWSTLFDELRDPLVVGLLVCLFALPALHTWLAKRLTWAYKVGGSLSWLGFLIQFALVAGIFATYRQIMRVMNMYP